MIKQSIIITHDMNSFRLTPTAGANVHRLYDQLYVSIFAKMKTYCR